MATFFSLELYTSSSSSSSLILLLLLSLITTIDRSDAAALNDVCSQTKQPNRCITLILSSVEGSEKEASLPKLGQDAILAALDAAGPMKMKVQTLYVSEQDPKLKSIYLNCLSPYENTVDALLLARDYLKLGQYNKVIDAAVVARIGVSGCAAAVMNNGGLRQGNDDTGILADAIAIVAKKLQS